MVIEDEPEDALERGTDQCPVCVIRPSSFVKNWIRTFAAMHADYILVIDDDPATQRLLQRTLSSSGHRVQGAASKAEALAWIHRQAPLLVLLELHVPDSDGPALCRELRQHWAGPMIVMSEQQEEQAKVTALDAGADDYLTKPLGLHELAARIRALLRRAGAAAPSTLVLGDLCLDAAQHRLFHHGVAIHLTPIEWKVFSLLACHPEHVLTYRMLLRQLWHDADDSRLHALQVHISQLRAKLNGDPPPAYQIVAVPGIGYRLQRRMVNVS